MKIWFLFPLFLFLILNVKAQNCDKISLNNKAARIAIDYDSGRSSLKSLDTASFLLDQAIECDSNYYTAYANKIQILILKKKYRDAISIVDIWIKGHPLEPGYYFLKGSLFARVGLEDSAYAAYATSLYYYDKKVKVYPDSTELAYTSAMLLSILFGRQQGLDYMDTFIVNHPDKKNLDFYKESLKHVDSTDGDLILPIN